MSGDDVDDLDICDDVDDPADDLTPASRPSRRTLAVAAVVVIALVAAVAATVVLRDQGLPDDGVFRLRGEVYDVDDLQQYLREQRALYGLEAVDLSDDEDRRFAAQSFAVSVVVDAAAAEADVSVSEEELDAATAQFLESSYPEGREAFIEALANEGVSEVDVTDELRRQLVIERLYAQVTAGLTVHVEAVRTAYTDNPQDFVVSPTRKISVIALANRRQATALRTQLTPGNFADLARRRSLDSTTATTGGDLGYRSVEDLQGPFAAASFAARRGEVFGPVRAPGADYVYLGLVRDIRPGRTQSFAEVQAELRRTLIAGQGLQRWQTYLNEKVSEADLKYSEKYRPAEPDSIPSFDLPEVDPSVAPRSSLTPGPGEPS